MAAGRCIIRTQISLELTEDEAKFIKRLVQNENRPNESVYESQIRQAIWDALEHIDISSPYNLGDTNDK